MEQDPSGNPTNSDDLEDDDSDVELPERALGPLPARRIELFGDDVLAVRLPDGSV